MYRLFSGRPYRYVLTHIRPPSPDGTRPPLWQRIFYRGIIEKIADFTSAVAHAIGDSMPK